MWFVTFNSVRIKVLQCTAVPRALSRAGALGALGTESPKSGAPGDWGTGPRDPVRQAEGTGGDWDGIAISRVELRSGALGGTGD